MNGFIKKNKKEKDFLREIVTSGEIIQRHKIKSLMISTLFL